MKLFAVLFCIAIMVSALSAGKTREEKEEEKEQRRANAKEYKESKETKKTQIEINLINQRLEMMQQTIDNTWTLGSFIKVDDINELKSLADEAHQHQDGFQTILDEVVSKIDEVVSTQEEMESDIKDAYAGHRSERGDEESILTAIQDAINNADLPSKSVGQFKDLHKRLITIHDKFRDYETFVKDAERKFVSKMFPKMSGSITPAIYELCKQARKAVYKQKVFKTNEIDEISKKAQKNIIDKLDKGLEWSHKDLTLSQMKDTNEKEYRKHYDAVKAKLDSIVKYLED